MLVNYVDAWDVVMEAWENVMCCEDESTFTNCVDRLVMFVFHSLYSLSISMKVG